MTKFKAGDIVIYTNDIYMEYAKVVEVSTTIKGTAMYKIIFEDNGLDLFVLSDNIKHTGHTWNTSKYTWDTAKTDWNDKEKEVVNKGYTPDTPKDGVFDKGFRG